MMSEEFFLCVVPTYNLRVSNELPDSGSVLGKFSSLQKDSCDRLVHEVQQKLPQMPDRQGLLNHCTIVMVREHEFRENDSALVAYRVQAKQMDLSVAEKSYDAVKSDVWLYMAWYSREIAKRLSIETVAHDDQEDGPCEYRTWRLDEKRLQPELFQRCTWELLNFLWGTRDKTTYFDHIPENVFKKHGEDITDKQVNKQRDLANQVFKKHKIPFCITVNSINRKVTLKRQ